MESYFMFGGIRLQLVSLGPKCREVSRSLAANSVAKCREVSRGLAAKSAAKCRKVSRSVAKCREVSRSVAKCRAVWRPKVSRSVAKCRGVLRDLAAKSVAKCRTALHRLQRLRWPSTPLKRRPRASTGLDGPTAASNILKSTKMYNNKKSFINIILLKIDSHIQ